MDTLDVYNKIVKNGESGVLALLSMCRADWSLQGMFPTTCQIAKSHTVETPEWLRWSPIPRSAQLEGRAGRGPSRIQRAEGFEMARDSVQDV